MIKIINASRSNLNDIYKLEKHLFKDQAYDLNSLKEELENQNRIYLLAVTDKGEFIGYLGVNLLYDFAEIIKIGVHESFQRQGIATMLLNNMIGKLKLKSVLKLMLEVDIENKKAVSFYEKFGFKQISLRKNYYSNNNCALIYEMIIA